MNFFLKIAKYLVFVLLVLFLIEAKASNDGSAGAGVPLAPLPTLPPFINEKPADDDKGEEEGDDDNDGSETDESNMNPRSLTYSAFYLSLDGHTLYAYPDGTHDSMSLWVCDVNDNILIHEIFEMDGETKSLILPQNFIGEYRVYLKVGTQYYVGGIAL